MARSSAKECAMMLLANKIAACPSCSTSDASTRLGPSTFAQYPSEKGGRMGTRRAGGRREKGGAAVEPLIAGEHACAVRTVDIDLI